MKAIVIAGAASGVGKTTVATAIMGALTARGYARRGRRNMFAGRRLWRCNAVHIADLILDKHCNRV